MHGAGIILLMIEMFTAGLDRFHISHINYIRFYNVNYSATYPYIIRRLYTVEVTGSNPVTPD